LAICNAAVVLPRIIFDVASLRPVAHKHQGTQRLCISGPLSARYTTQAGARDRPASLDAKLAGARSLRGPVVPAWCAQIPTPGENQLYPYSGHSCAHRRPHGFRKLFMRDVKSRKPGVVMSIIPLDLERRCERRWAAQFSRPIPSVAPRNQRRMSETLQIAEPAKSKEKPAGLKRQA
jgi:hypothetical protein